MSNQQIKYFLGCKVTKTNGILFALGILFVGLALVAKLNTRYELRWNLSSSIPAHFFVVDKKQMPKKGDYIAFNYYDISNDDYKMGLLDKPPAVVFIKRVAGIQGDVVTQSNREFFINGKSVGTAKKEAKNGRVLNQNPFEGQIPDGYYYVNTPHKDSYDSRYADVGLIHVSEIDGVAYAY